MSQAHTEGEPSGPPQSGRGVQGQYVYWVCMSHPKQETVERLGVKVPGDFTREQFSSLMVKAHRECEVEIVETVCFLEPHANGQKHHNCLLRASKQFRWLRVAQHLRRKYKVCVDYGTNVKTWAEGVVYGRVGSEHKGPESLDQHFMQWAKNGCPADLAEFIPRPWAKEGFVRKTKMTYLAFLDLCRKHSVTTETAVWALAADLEEKGDKGLMAYLMAADVPGVMAKVAQAVGAKETARRSKMSRMDILREAHEKGTCKCAVDGACYGLMKDILAKNNYDGEFQQAVVGTLETGRMKMRNLCLVGPADSAKSYLFKPLALIFTTYTRPDGGSHQLETLLGKELIFLNDFEYDEDAKKWCPWQFFKRFLEGEELTVAVPKTRGGNQTFDLDSPVFMTAPQEVSLWRGKHRDDYETAQMSRRISYRRLTYSVPEDQRKETKPCAHCGARLYLEGAAQAGAVRPVEPASSSAEGVKRNASEMEAAAASQPSSSRQKTGLEMLQALEQLHSLKQDGLLNSPEAKKLKERILNGN